jgi:hypothetical protein
MKNQEIRKDSKMSLNLNLSNQLSNPSSGPFKQLHSTSKISMASWCPRIQAIACAFLVGSSGFAAIEKKSAGKRDLEGYETFDMKQFSGLNQDAPSGSQFKVQCSLASGEKVSAGDPGFSECLNQVRAQSQTRKALDQSNGAPNRSQNNLEFSTGQ